MSIESLQDPTGEETGQLSSASATRRRAADDATVSAPQSVTPSHTEDGHPRFDMTVPPGGYAWWYVDGLSDDGRHAITLIAFVGSVFSPYYYVAGRRNPEAHCALNVAVYGPGARWAMTERPAASVQREKSQFQVGPSSVRWERDRMVLDVNETGFPSLLPIRGRVTVHPSGLGQRAVPLDAKGTQTWWAIAPVARIEVELDRPDLKWSGHGYIDMNYGSTMLEEGFRRWDWSRLTLSDGTAVLYEAERRDDSNVALGLKFDKDGQDSTFDLPPASPMKKTLWRVHRTTRADPGGAPQELMRCEDSPFYSRSVIGSRILGETVTGMHESLDLDRFASPFVKMLLPCRMPRALW